MEAVTFKPAYIEQPTPAKGSTRAGHFTSDLAALGLHSGQHGFDGGRYRNAKRFAGATLGAGKGKNAILQIDAIQRDLRLSQTTASGQGNLKADFHPYGHALNGQGFPGDFNLIVRKHWLDVGNRAALNTVIEQGNRIHLSKQSALAVNPFQDLQVLAGLVASSLTAGGAGKALAPSQINFTIGWRKRLQSYFFFDNKSRKMTPAISVIHFCQRGNRMILDQILDPIVAAIFSLFVNAKSGGLSRCLGSVQRIVRSVAGAFATPFSSRVFKTYKEPRAAAFLVRIRHGYIGNIYIV
jgi:hypothetical protein